MMLLIFNELFFLDMIRIHLLYSYHFVIPNIYVWMWKMSWSRQNSIDFLLVLEQCLKRLCFIHHNVHNRYSRDHKNQMIFCSSTFPFLFFFLDVRMFATQLWIESYAMMISSMYIILDKHTLTHPIRMFFSLFLDYVVQRALEFGSSLTEYAIFFPSLTEINPSQKLCIAFQKVLHQCYMLIQYLSASHDIWKRLARMVKILLWTLKACRQIPATF